ncbi:hypothetical protein [Amycolatopsis alkalitolerans]|uniref:Uncharacterized protein n=1 Tax=Amycolatopsis alkalitolerans TaxID=2547244 RepID=A0A5C4LT99_9PSEU|nr:hypothetical protein [Amycolatopsis alkalitolerans]TNC21403.1 hypothetical protein FG385_28160 [Amycolatopsis alkalitolerans]
MSAPQLTSEKPDMADVRPSAAPVTTKEITEMLIYEELARARIQDLRRDIHAQQRRGHARAARRWDRIAGWAAQRARRHRS